MQDPREGLWVGVGDRYVHGSRDKWSVFSAGATVNKLAADGTVLWMATDDGAIRFDSGSRGVTRVGIDDGLPSQAVTAVAVDEQFVWFATNKGLARYRKLDRTWRVFTDADGLPHRAVNDVLVVGRQLWMGTRGGLALYDAATDGVRTFKGLAGEDVAELFLVGEDVWCRTDVGLSRFRPRTRTFTNFSFADMGGATELRAWAVDGARVWLGTDAGLVTFETTSDTFVKFVQQASLKSASIRGLELQSEFLFITTDEEVVQFHKTNLSLRRFTEADGLAWRPGVIGTFISGSAFTVLFPDGALVYVVERDLWQARSLDTTQAEQRTRSRFLGRLNTQLPVNLLTGKLDEQRFANAEGGFGFSHRFVESAAKGKRTLDASARLDYGQLELSGVRDVTARLDYQGAPDDPLREVKAEDRFLYRSLVEGLERPLALWGGHARVSSEGDKPKVGVTGTGGLRRGAVVRDFFTGVKDSTVALSHRYVLPGSERVYVDGELLTQGTDYTVIYPAGQLAFLDVERADALSIVEVEYEIDLQPRKGLGVLSLLDLLPADKEVGDWTRSGEARMVSDETALYAQIDGAAPRYIDRGWVKSVFSEYRSGGRTLQVTVHDMGTETNARAIFQFDLPPARETIGGKDTVVLDLGLAASYAVRAVLGSYYLELSIDEKADAARQSLRLFALQVLDRGSGAGANRPGENPEWLLGARLASNPTERSEVGLRVVKNVGTTGPAQRDLLTTVGDARYELPLGEQGLLTGYGELAGSFNQVDRGHFTDGMAALGRVRVSHPFVEGTLSLRHNSEHFTPLGSTATRFGALHDEGRGQATVYPVKWLPLTAFYTRASSYTGSGAPGIEQHAMGRVQLAKEGLPTASLQLGHTLLEGDGATTGRIKASAQADYDFAQGLLSFTKMKRFAVRALYSFSQAAIDEGAGPRDDQVQLMRVEGRLAPTSTESAWALFRHRQLVQRPDSSEPFSPATLKWELLSGARSAIIPGLIPQLSYSASYEDDQVSQPRSVRAGRGVFATALGVQPGQWWSALAPLMVEPRFSLASDAKAEGDLKTGLDQTTRFDNRAMWAGAAKVDVELFELWEVTRTGADQATKGTRLELRNRVTFRPTPTSPITARFNYTKLQSANDLALVADAPVLGNQYTWESVLEWLKRWSPLVTTRIRGVYGGGEARDLVQAVATGGGVLSRFTQHRVGTEFELRLTRTTDSSNLLIVQRDRLYRLFGVGAGASEAVTFDASLGIVWALGDKLYLDAQVLWRKTFCLGGACTLVQALEPRALLTFDL